MPTSKATNVLVPLADWEEKPGKKPDTTSHTRWILRCGTHCWGFGWELAGYGSLHQAKYYAKFEQMLPTMFVWHPDWPQGKLITDIIGALCDRTDQPFGTTLSSMNLPQYQGDLAQIGKAIDEIFEVNFFLHDPTRLFTTNQHTKRAED